MSSKSFSTLFIILIEQSLREKCPNTEFFLVCIFPWSVRIRQNMDQKKTPYLETFRTRNVSFETKSAVWEMLLFGRFHSRDSSNQISLVIRQKGESRNGGNKKTKRAKFSEKRTFFTPW